MRTAALCMGIGGLERGLEAFGGELAWCAEVDAAASQVIEAWWPGVVNVGDITTADFAGCEPVDVLTAGYPCQPFSLAGSRKGTADVRHLWPHVARAVRVLRPRHVFLENVPGHLSLGFGTVVGDLAAVGYDTEWGCVRASQVGAPHRRERVFVVATNTGRVGRDTRPGLCEGDEVVDGHGVAGRGSSPADADGGTVRVEPVADTGSGCASGPRRDRQTAPDADGEGSQGSESEAGRLVSAWRSSSGWGRYAAAVAAWEAVHGPAPEPLVDGRLNPDLTEWMMGYPPGWTSMLGRADRLRVLGNAVVPHVAVVAWAMLTV